MSLHNTYAGDDKTINLNKLQEEAQERLVDKRGAGETIIHHHKHGEKCAGIKHDFYPVSLKENFEDTAV
jgi:hypothetical protein